MKTFLISDNHDTKLAMRLAGIEGVIVHEREEILREFHQALENKEIGIIILSELAAEKIKEEIIQVKLTKTYPLLIEIPDRHGQRKNENYITQYINESIGIKI